MNNMRAIYRDIKDWAVLDKKIIHDYTPSENPIEIVLVLIGTLHYTDFDFFNQIEQKRTPITRWITLKKYNYLKDHEGEIIW